MTQISATAGKIGPTPVVIESALAGFAGKLKRSESNAAFERLTTVDNSQFAP